MNTLIEISSLTEYINQIDEVTHPEKSYLYRGQEDEAWRVTSSAYRRLVSSSEDLGPEVDLPPYPLRHLYQNYLLKIIGEIKLRYPSTYRDLSPLECMAHLQHNRVATGLIDFTFSPLVALWFACTNENINGKVIVLENDSEKIEEITTIEQLQQDLAVFFPIDKENWYLWSPTLDSQIVDTQRLVMQQSVFLFGLPEIDTEMITQEITIRSGDKANIRTALEKMGISERTLFSDLLGFFERNSATQPYNLSVDALGS
ncbi:MAG: FRG domain-containing protein [Candidatus Poribacteria bacterium]|nr:FRG domain-containing protein [Candidatus Poribacteria bacterium]